MLQKYLNISCGITRTIELILKNSSFTSKMFVMTYGGNNTKVLSCGRVKSYGNFLNLYLSLLKILLLCENNQIIIHSFHRTFDFSIFLLKKIFPKIKTVTSAQSKVYGKRFFSYKSDLILACSNAIKNHLIDHFRINSNRVRVIYNFIDPNFIKSIIEKSDQFNVNEKKNKITIGFIGRLNVKEKGIDILLKSFLEIFSKDGNFDLIFVGEGEDEDMIRQYKSIYKLPITIVQSQNNVYKYFDLIDILVLPSRVEPFGIVIIEAGFIKKPVIASRVDGIPEIINDGINGLLFESENHLQLADKIMLLKSDKELTKQLTDENYKKVINLYLADQIVPKYEREYQSLLQT